MAVPRVFGFPAVQFPDFLFPPAAALCYLPCVVAFLRPPVRMVIVQIHLPVNEELLTPDLPVVFLAFRSKFDKADGLLTEYGHGRYPWIHSADTVPGVQFFRGLPVQIKNDIPSSAAAKCFSCDLTVFQRMGHAFPDIGIRPVYGCLHFQSVPDDQIFLLPVFDPVCRTFLGDGM